MCSSYRLVPITHYCNSMLQFLQHSYNDKDNAADLKHALCIRNNAVYKLFFYEVILVLAASMSATLWI